jgi:hypothetical protein
MVSTTTVKRLHQFIWVLIFGGLLTLVLGLFLRGFDEAYGWTLISGGGIAAGVGFVLIYVRSRMKVDS